MPQNITDVDTFTDPVTAPADGDPLNAASIITNGIQPLSNRTRNLANRTGGGAGTSEWTYEDAPRTREVIIGSRNGNGEPGWTYNLIDRATCSTNIHDLFIDLDPFLPSGAVLKKVEMLVKPGTAQSSGNRMELSVWKTDMGAAFTTPADPTDTQIGSTGEDAGSNAYQVVGIGTVTDTIDKSTYTYVAHVRAGQGAGSTADWFFALRLTFEDQGPRNH